MNGTTTIAEFRDAVLDPAKRAHYRLAWLSTVDHKRIAVLYMLTGLVFFVVGGVEALFMRLQLAIPNNHFLQPDTFNQLFTMHGTTMIFLVAMPVLFGIMNYILPLQIGARDMAFPRLNALGVWLVPFGGILLHFSFLAGGPPAVGRSQRHAPARSSPRPNASARRPQPAPCRYRRHRRRPPRFPRWCRSRSSPCVRPSAGPMSCGRPARSPPRTGTAPPPSRRY